MAGGGRYFCAGMDWSTGLLGSGEVFQALRLGLFFALLQMRNPKTFGRAAKHQATRIDPPDILKLLDIAFGSLPRELELWLFSVGTLRRRLHTLQSRFGLLRAGKPDFKLSSFRPGGATWMLAATEAVAFLPKCGIFC